MRSLAKKIFELVSRAWIVHALLLEMLHVFMVIGFGGVKTARNSMGSFQPKFSIP